MSRMVRKQIYVSPEQNRRLRQVAARERRTEADVIREALDRHLRSTAARDLDPMKDPLWQTVGIGESDGGDAARNVNHYLYGYPKR